MHVNICICYFILFLYLLTIPLGLKWGEKHQLKKPAVNKNQERNSIPQFFSKEKNGTVKLLVIAEKQS